MSDYIRKKTFAPLIIMSSLVLSGYSQAEIEISGYYKNIFLSSKTVITPTEDYLLDINRLRLQFNGDIGENTTFNFEYDNEVLLNNYLSTQQFKQQKLLSDPGYFNLQSTYLDTSAAYARQLLYRGYITSSFSDIDVTLGRQRISWGTAYMWNPMDILNPFNPLQLERAERPGVDAILLDWNAGDLTRISLVNALHDSGSSSSTALRARSNFNGFDMSLLAGEFRGKQITGFDFSGQAGQVGLKGELTYTQPQGNKAYIQAVVGADYTFAGTFFMEFEYYYNGQGTTDRNQYNYNLLFNGTVQSLAQHYLGLFIGGDITPLLRFENVLIFNLDDKSYFLYPSLGYSLGEDITLSLGLQLFNGKNGTEFAAINNLYFAQLQWFF